MLVKNIVKRAINLLNLQDLSDAIENDNLNDLQSQNLNLLVDCVNLTTTHIATNYCKLYEVVKVTSNKELLPFSEITNKQIYDIISVKNNNKRQDFVITPNGIVTKTGNLQIKFSYFPEDLAYNDELLYFPIKISERVFVFGVVSEFLYVKGVFDEAKMWREKFNYEMKMLLRNCKSVNLANAGRWI